MKVLVYGSKEFGIVLKHLSLSCGHEFKGFIDDIHEGPEVMGTYEHVKTCYSNKRVGVVNAVGYNNLEARAAISAKLLSDGYQMPTLIHETAYIADTAEIACGCAIMAHAVVDSNSRIETGAVLWPSVTVNHDCVVGSDTFLAPGCTICGCTLIGDKCFIGAGAVVVDHLRVPSDSFIKANTTYKQKTGDS